jgi:S1-C subfamily serine protease
VTNASLAAKVGFVNFPMHDFGVRSARLKALALTPTFPVPGRRVEEGATETPRTVAGLTLKSIETLGEQSAAGLGSKAGVLVLAVEAGSSADAAGYRPRDVIVGTVDGGAITDTTSFMAALAERKGEAGLVVVRNQTTLRLRWP